MKIQPLALYRVVVWILALAGVGGYSSQLSQTACEDGTASHVATQIMEGHPFSYPLGDDSTSRILEHWHHISRSKVVISAFLITTNPDGTQKEVLPSAAQPNQVADTRKGSFSDVEFPRAALPAPSPTPRLQPGMLSSARQLSPVPSKSAGKESYPPYTGRRAHIASSTMVLPFLNGVDYWCRGPGVKGALIRDSRAVYFCLFGKACHLWG